MSVVLVPLAILMGAATYPWRAVPLLAPGIHRLPAAIQLYLRLVGPEWLAVGLCIGLVALRRSLLVGLVLAAALIAVLRAVGLA